MAVVVIIAGADALAPAGARDACFQSDIGKGAVAIVFVEAADGFGAFGESGFEAACR